MSSKSADFNCFNLALKFFSNSLLLALAMISVLVLGSLRRNIQQNVVTKQEEKFYT